MKTKIKKRCSKDYINYVILAIIVLILSLLKLDVSPIGNDIPAVDSSVFQIMGKGLINNQIIYKDLFDHKGPIVYVINALAYIISPNIGLFMIEIIFIYIGVLFIYKSSKEFLNEKLSLITSLVYLMPIFSYIDGGNYTEEYAITFTNIALYNMLKIFFKNQYNQKVNWIIIGATFAVNFMIKPTYIGIWVAFGIVQLMCSIKDKKIKELFKYILYMFYGIMSIFIPIFLYLIIKNDIKDFINAYFIMNMNYSKTTMYNRIVTFKELVICYKGLIYLILMLLGNMAIIFSRKINKRTKNFITIFNIITLIFSAWAANVYQHYLLQIAPGVALNMIILLYEIKNKLCTPKIENVIKQVPIGLIYICIIIVLIFLNIIYKLNINTEKSRYKYNESKRNIFMEIDKYLDKDDELFVLGNDESCYLILNRQPRFKYFFQNPIFIYNDEIIQETEKYLTTKMPKVILKYITENEELFEEKSENINKMLNENYEEFDRGKLKYYVLKEIK